MIGWDFFCFRFKNIDFNHHLCHNTAIKSSIINQQEGDLNDYS